VDFDARPSAIPEDPERTEKWIERLGFVFSLPREDEEKGELDNGTNESSSTSPHCG
jgi:hypothetical protein